MEALLIPVDGTPVTIDLKADENGSTLRELQRLVGGPIEPLNVLFGEEISIYVNEEGLYSCPPNRALYATKRMEDAGYLSQMDFHTPVHEGDLYTVLFGNLVAVGFDPETGEDRPLTDGECQTVRDYFTRVSAPGSGLSEVLSITKGPKMRQDRAESRNGLREEASEMRSSSSALAGGHKGQNPFEQDRQA